MGRSLKIIVALLVVLVSLPGGEAVGLPAEVLPDIPWVAGAGEQGYLDWPADGTGVVALAPADHGAVPDDGQPDDEAFVALLAAARKLRRDGAWVDIVLPAGRFDFERPLYLDCSGCRVRGAGREGTSLYFHHPLRKYWQALDYVGGKADEVSWRGGLVMVEPDPLDMLKAEEHWVAVGAAEEGARDIHLGEALPDLEVGDLVSLRYTINTAFARHIFGHPSADQVPWEEWHLIDERDPCEWPWHSRVAAVDGGKVTLSDPLRVAIREDWPVVMAVDRKSLQEVIIRDLAIEAPRHVAASKQEAKEDPSLKRYAHLREDGWNGLYLHGVVGFRATGLRFRNVDSALFIEQAAHGRIVDVVVEGDEDHLMHHGVSHRFGSNDVLVERYEQRCRVWHGHSVQDLAAGNVLRDSRFTYGALDCHRGMPFDNVRTNVTFEHCNGRGGGAKGPFCGRRIVHWNIRITDHLGKKAGMMVNPDQYVRGVLAGIVGAEVKGTGKGWAMPPGDKGTIVLGDGQPVEPLDLYEWQRTQPPPSHP